MESILYCSNFAFKHKFNIDSDMDDKVGIFSFFSGAGFLDLGFESTNHFQTLYVNEYHKVFNDIYKYSRQKIGIEPPVYGHQVGDIATNLTGLDSLWLNDYMKDARQKYNLIGFIGGPPCPDFSVAGKNRGHEGENGKLSGTYVELISRMKPDFFLFENVKGLYRTTKHRAFFESIKRKLISEGYNLTEKLINAIEYGAPQDRDRIILIGFKKDTLSNMGIKPTKSSIIENFNWEKHTLYSADKTFKMQWPGLDKFINNSTTTCPVNIPIELTVQYWFDKNNIEDHPNSKHYFTPRAGLEKFKVIDEGDVLKKSYKRLHRWRYSPTAAYGNNEVHLHPYRERRISVAEALAIQSMPASFSISDNISLTDMFKTIGNGVPFLAAQGLANTILDFIYSNTTITKTTTYAEANS